MNRFAIQIVIQEAIRCLYYVEFLPMFPECLLPVSWYGCTECFVREILAPVLASSSEHCYFAPRLHHDPPWDGLAPACRRPLSVSLATRAQTQRWTLSSTDTWTCACHVPHDMSCACVW